MTVNNYVDLASVKAYMPTNEVATTVIWDDLVTTLSGNLSRLFDRLTNRKPGAYFVNADVVRYFDGPGYGMFSPIYGYRTQRLSRGYTGAISLPVGELAALPTEVAMTQTAQIQTGGGTNAGNYTVVPATDYYAEPQNALDDGQPYRKLTLDIINGTTRVWLPYKRGIRIAGKFGYSAVVPSDVQQALFLLVVKFLRKAQQNYQETGTILDAGQVMTGSKVDEDISMLVKLYRRLPV